VNTERSKKEIRVWGPNAKKKKAQARRGKGRRKKPMVQKVRGRRGAPGERFKESRWDEKQKGAGGKKRTSAPAAPKPWFNVPIKNEKSGLQRVGQGGKKEIRPAFDSHGTLERIEAGRGLECA